MEWFCCPEQEQELALASVAHAAVITICSAFLCLVAVASTEGQNRSFVEKLELYNDEQEKLLPQFLSKEHLEPIALRQWKVVLGWIAFHPEQVSKLKDTKGQTALHHAALFRAPEHVIESILWAAPELASLPNQDGELALHWAVRLSTSPPILSLLLKANPETAFWRDREHSSPLSLLWERHQNSLFQTWRSDKEQLLGESNKAWKRVMSFFRAVHDSRSTAGKFLPLHIAASYPLPPSLFPLMIEVFRTMLEEKDENSHCPLIVACQYPDANRSYDVQTKIQLLIRACPDAVGWKDPKTGRYPLHFAVASGVFWDDGAQCLMEHLPQSISIRDPKTGLFPSALAAMKKDNASTVLREDARWLTTIYSLLRADPSVLKAA